MLTLTTWDGELFKQTHWNKWHLVQTFDLNTEGYLRPTLILLLVSTQIVWYSQSWGQLLCLQFLLSLNSFSSNCWIHRPSMAPFSMSCYTTAATLPPILLSGDCRGCGAALLPWQQALSHSPHITRAVWPPLRRRHHTEGLGGGVGAEPVYFTSCADTSCPLNPNSHTSLSL